MQSSLITSKDLRTSTIFTAAKDFYIFFLKLVMPATS